MSGKSRRCVIPDVLKYIELGFEVVLAFILIAPVVLVIINLVELARYSLA